MAKKVSKKTKKKAKSKKGDKFKCNSCGLTVTVANDCGCEECDIVCCGEQMECI